MKRKFLRISMMTGKERQGPKKKVSKEIGEYIDYEEIKKINPRLFDYS